MYFRQLLVGDAGRPDFNGGDPFAQFDSVQRLLSLPEWMVVYPGHFEGACGAAPRPMFRTIARESPAAHLLR